MTGLIASIVEAYGELRVNKGRILLSLIGVAFSVFALTAVLGAGGMLSGALQQSSERMDGRPTVLMIDGYSEDETVSTEDIDQVVLEEFDRMGIDQRSRKRELEVRMDAGHGAEPLTVSAVDPSYADMFRLRTEQGRWLADSDQERLAPVLVVNQPAYESLGAPELGTESVSLLSGEEPVDAVVIGVLGASGEDYMPQAFMAAGGVDALGGSDELELYNNSYLAWVPPESSGQVASTLTQHLSNTSAGSFEAYDNSFDQSAEFDAMTNAVAIVAVVILLLGAMGLVNISLVTVRYRVREIGIRRSYGATGLRIFVGVLMESVVATVLAGAIGVTGAVALVRAPFVQDFFASIGLVDLPPFPASAVLTGLGAATAVGVLAGALPAIIATRIKVIDAIRS